MNNLSEEDAWMMPREAFEWIEEHIPIGSKVLEFGSGKGTERLSHNYTLFSIEHNPEWIGRYNSNYIYAPIKLAPTDSSEQGIGWYDIEIIKQNLPDEDFALIIIDGPPASIGRSRILNHLWILGKSDYILIDDLHRKEEYSLSQRIAKECNLKCLHLFKESKNVSERQFGIFVRN
mgnify:CR=1 FL=1|jgi:hypothetical protein